MTAHTCLRWLTLGGGLAVILGTLTGTAAATVSEDPGALCSTLVPPDCSPVVKIKGDLRTKGGIAAAAAPGERGAELSECGGGRDAALGAEVTLDLDDGRAVRRNERGA